MRHMTSNPQGIALGKPGSRSCNQYQITRGVNETAMSKYVDIEVGSEEHAIYAIEKERGPVSKTTDAKNRTGFKKLEEFLKGSAGQFFYIKSRNVLLL